MSFLSFFFSSTKSENRMVELVLPRDEEVDTSVRREMGKGS
jgi:hypothetical protein